MDDDYIIKLSKEFLRIIDGIDWLHAKKVAAEYERMREANKTSFKEEIEVWYQALKSAGYVPPKNEKDFFDWFFFVKHNDEPLTIEAMQQMAEITPDLFREFSEYKKLKFGYLEKPEAIPEQGTDTRPLFPYFHGANELDLAIRAAIKTGIISKAGKWAKFGYKTHTLSVFWRACVTANLAKPDAPVYKVAPAAGEQFGMPFGQNAINLKKDISDFGEDYNQLYKDLLGIMQP